MHLQHDEQVLKVVHHHLLPFLLRGFKIIIASLPFYFTIFLLSSLFETSVQLILHLSVTAIFGLVLFYDLCMFYLDQLVITNKRVIHVDWVNLIKKRETEAMIEDIQDIETSEYGFLSRLKIFDYGTFEVETASAKTSIVFTHATDPEGIKHFIYNITKTHSSLNSSATQVQPGKKILEKTEQPVESQRFS